MRCRVCRGKIADDDGMVWLVVPWRYGMLGEPIAWHPACHDGPEVPRFSLVCWFKRVTAKKEQ